MQQRIFTIPENVAGAGRRPPCPMRTFGRNFEPDVGLHTLNRQPGGTVMNQPRRVLGLVALVAACALILAAWPVGAQPENTAARSKPKPDVQNAKYGPHQRNVLDLWKAKSD